MRRSIYISGRPAPKQQAPAATYTMDHRLAIWTRQLFWVAVFISAILVAYVIWPGRHVSGSIDVTMRHGFVTQLSSAQPCAASMEFAHPEDELCAIWLDDQQRVVMGPLWARP